MDTILTALAIATAALLAWTGTVKLLGRTSADGLTVLLRNARLARAGLRAVGAAELGVAVLLVLAPRAGGLAAGVLGVGFLGYLAAAARVAPGTSCGCAGSPAPIGWRTYARASAVTVAGAAVGLALDAAAVNASGGALTVLAALGYLALSPELDRLWLRPLRRLRLRVLGHPLAVFDTAVPVAASVELLESSLAWQASAHLVRSSLLEHWTTGDWRLLRYAGRDDDRPVTVLFAVDLRATTSNPRGTQIRVTVVDDRTGDVLTEPPLRTPRIRPLPVA